MSVNKTLDIGAQTDPAADDDNDSLLLSILIPTFLILLIIGALIALCYVSHTACFAERQHEHSIRVMNDEVIRTKLIDIPGRESVV